MGVILDLDAETAEVPEDKVRKTSLALEAARGEAWVGADAIESMLGLMGFCSQVLVPGGWRTCWTVVALKIGAHNGFAPMNGYWQAEIDWWLRLLTDWNRVAMMMPKVWLEPEHAAHLAPFTDASRALGEDGEALSGGAGAVFGALAMHFEFTELEIQWLPICDLEGLVHVLWLKQLCERCPEEITRRRFVTWCDNQSFVGAVNAHKSNAPTLAFLLEVLHDLMARYSFDIKVEFVRSEENVAADAASRGEWERFYSFMRDTTGLQKSDIVMLDVQEQVRCEWSSKLRSIRILQERMTEK
jgi:hypothetical protein